MGLFTRPLDTSSGWLAAASPLLPAAYRLPPLLDSPKRLPDRATVCLPQAILANTEQLLLCAEALHDELRKDGPVELVTERSPRRSHHATPAAIPASSISHMQRLTRR